MTDPGSIFYYSNAVSYTISDYYKSQWFIHPGICQKYLFGPMKIEKAVDENE
jgi:hypothetical protein